MNSKMKHLDVERIKDSAQGLCGLLDVLFDDYIIRGLGTDEKELHPGTFSKLLQSSKVLAHQLNADTESLEDYVNPNAIIKIGGRQ